MRIFLAIAIAVLPLVTLGQVPFSLQDRAFLQTTSPLRKDLAGYWRLEEASGTRYDFSKNGNHLTSNNNVGQAAGVSAYTGNAATFASASTQWLSIPSNSSVVMGDIDFTIACWVKMTTTNLNAAFVGKFTDATHREYALDWQNSANRWEFLVSATGTAWDGSAFITNNILTGTWYFLVGWHDAANNSANLQVNNGSVRTTSYSSGCLASTNVFSLGAVGAGIAPHNGSIDEVGVWKRVLTTAERTQLYNAGLGTHFPWAHP